MAQIINVSDYAQSGDTNDHAAIQRAIDSATKGVMKNPTDPDRSVVVQFQVGRRELNVDQEFGFTAHGDVSAPIVLDMRGVRIRGQNDASHDMLVIKNEGSGNLRNWQVLGGHLIWGARGLVVEKAHYGTIDGLKLDQQWVRGADLSTNGGAETNHVNRLTILQQRGDSLHTNGSWHLKDCVFGEMMGAVRCKNGTLSFSESRFFGAALYDLKGLASVGFNPVPNGMKPMFHQQQGANLRFNNCFISATGDGDPDTVFWLDRGGDLTFSGRMEIGSAVTSIARQGRHHANRNEGFAKFSFDPLEMSASIPLWEEVYSNVERRGHVFATGIVKAENAGRLTTDAAEIHVIDVA